MRLFLFPLPQTLLVPGTTKPLNVFEPRYLKMLERSVAEKVPIGILMMDSTEQILRPEVNKPLTGVVQVVGYGLPQVVESRADGSRLILLPGYGKAELGVVREVTDGYVEVEAKEMSEINTVTESSKERFTTILKLLLHWLNLNIPDESAREQFRRHLTSEEQIVACAIAYLVLDSDLQQYLLELNHIDDKVDHLLRILSR